MNLEHLKTSLSEIVEPAFVSLQGDIVKVCPANEEQVSKAAAFASELGIGLVPQGSGSQSYLGDSIKKQGIVLSLERMNQVLEYSAADLTITVQAGTPLLAMQQLLASARQWLPLDPAVSDRATIGGLIATNANGPKRVLYGALRDQVIGLRVVYPDGSVIKTGGKVMKNVAGYDMNKLFIGSLGTLGIITEATFKLRPLPSYQELVFIDVPDLQEANRLQAAVLNSELIPSALELLNTNLSDQLLGRAVYTVVVGCDEGKSAALYQRKRILELAGGRSSHLLAEEEAEEFWRRHQKIMSPESAEFASVKISLLPMQVAPFLQLTQEICNQENLSFLGSAGLGTGLLHLTIGSGNENDVVADRIASILQQLRTYAEADKGSLIIQKGPDSLKRQISVWGTPPGSFFLMKGIKEKIDPNFILNCGRYVGGL